MPPPKVVPTTQPDTSTAVRPSPPAIAAPAAIATPPAPAGTPVPRRPAARARVTTYPNRDKRESRATRVIVIAILLASIALVLAVTIGGWSDLEGMKAINFAWCAIYLVIAYYVSRWKRGLLPIAAALAVLLAGIALIAGTGLFGTSWFDRAHEGFAAPQSLFGGGGLDADTLGVLTLAIVPVQILLVLFAMSGFAQGWNVEVDVPAPERP